MRRNQKIVVDTFDRAEKHM